MADRRPDISDAEVIQWLESHARSHRANNCLGENMFAIAAERLSRTDAQAAGLAAGTHVVVPAVHSERVKLNEDGTLDEVVTNGGAHLEQMSERGWFLSMVRADGSEFCVWFDGRVMMTEERPIPKRLAAAQKEG